jgi:CheY-specific phosphatase CheX
MKSVSELLAAEGGHQSWIPLLDTAAREVFELMLGCQISNMVAGNFKNKIAGLAEGCMLSPPTVITGSDYNLHSMADSPAIEVRTLFESMPIIISLEIHS